ncbi:MAG: mxaA protein [Paraburkholderia sp.]|jgi:mxaA protein|uniref:calcium incorporation protein MxaA n=1 Tax=Paraburkholderia sp. TaxID=1926495 RepID=UPI002AFE8890|nr:calcium incorporation protein MxaA [Paraburkholderia sp.]MEA3087360.1 mxaA protein [Paraburkholderia sp.]
MTLCGLRVGFTRGLHNYVLIAAWLAAAHAASSAAATAVPAIVQQPRAFGYVLGDVLTQRVLLQAGGNDVSNVTPPSVGRAGVWLERRPASFETDADGRRWIVIGYQIVNAPPTLTKITLPALTLTSPGGAQLQVPEWPASVGPLTPPGAFAAGDLQPLRPDREAPLPASAGLRRQMTWALGLLLATLLAWVAWWWWRNLRESARLPFARAWRHMQRLRGAQAASSKDAWFCLHHALNETAGQVVHSGSLSALFARAPYLQPLRAQLEHFYQVSAERFFKPAPGAAEFPLQTLCRALYRAERRHQR